MSSYGTAGVIAVSLLLVGLVPATAQAQEDPEGITFCGEERYGVQLRLHNPDLNPWNDPVPEDHAYSDSEEVPPVDETLVESSWQFFNQFQAVVDTDHPNAPALSPEEDDGIQSWWFGFGPIKEAAVFEEREGCEKPWAPGIQLYSYRSDANPEDGFFVPINTTGVPDGTYGYVLYACTERTYADCQPTGVDAPGSEDQALREDNLVAAVWGQATVYNGREHCEEGQFQGTPMAGHDLSCMRQYDFIKPWPVVLPGDGRQTNDEACDVPPARCVTIEFAERLDTQDGSQAPDQKAVRFWFNGVEKTDELQAWTPEPRDNDLIPGNDGPHTGHPLSSCQPVQPVQEQLPPDARACQKIVWGDGFSWEIPRSVQSQDEFRVWAMDGAGNEAEKVISFEDETRGAIIPLIEADLEVSIEPPRQKIRPGDAKTFTVHVNNTGNDTVHTFPKAESSDDLELTLSSDHVDVAGHSNRTIKLLAAPAGNASEGDLSAAVVFEYITGQRRVEEKAFATVEVDQDAQLSAEGRQGSDPGTGNSSGGPGAQATEGFNRTCSIQADLQVCFVHPDPVVPGEAFTFEVQVQQAKEDVEARHEFSAGQATLTLRYLDAEGEETVVEPQTFDMEEVDNGVYRAEVTPEDAPTIHAVFDSEKVQVLQVIKEPETTGDEGNLIPGPQAALLVVILGATAVARASTRRS